MIDTSRHFYSVKILKEIIHACSIAKFNIFHWHIMDDDSFPLEVSAYPNLS